MKVRVLDLIGPALNWAVAKCEGYAPVQDQPLGYLYHDGEDGWYDPSTDWAQGGPIIEREKIDVFRITGNTSVWEAGIFRTDVGKEHRHQAQECGPTPLVAAMRCWVAATLGDEIEIPEELR